MTSYWFRSLTSCEKVVENSLAKINHRAKREADKFGQAVQVYVDKMGGMKSHRQVSMARNPTGPRKGQRVTVNRPGIRAHGKSGKISGFEHDKEYAYVDFDDKSLNSTFTAPFHMNFLRNPIDFAPPEYYFGKAKGDARAAEVARARRPARLAVHKRRGWVGGEKAKAASGYIVKAPEIKHSEHAATLEEAKRIARSLAKQGYKAEVHSA